MKNDLDKYHLIDRYLRGELSEAELEQFNTELTTDQAFAEEVDLQRSVNDLISEQAYSELKQQMTKDIAQLDKSSSIKKWFGAGLIAVAIGSIGIYLSDHNEAPSHIEAISATLHEDSVSSLLFSELDKKEIKETGATETTSATTDAIVTKKEPEKKAEPMIDRQTRAISTDTSHLISQAPDVAIDTSVVPENKPKSDTKKAIAEEKNTLHADNMPQDPCKQVEIKVPYKVEKACIAQHNGTIKVNKDQIHGGTAPYVVKLIDIERSVELIYAEDLRPGAYLLKVTDASGCATSKELIIDEKPCNSTHIAIAPDYGETWTYYCSEHISYYISILDRSGQLIYRSPMLSGNTQWAGRSDTGTPVPAGLYIYIVEYGNGKKEHGQITITR